MVNISDKADNTAGATGELSADEYNDHKNELQESVDRSAQTLSQTKTPNQLGRAMFINGAGASSFQDSSSGNTIILTPVTGASGLIFPDAYSQMDGMIAYFSKSSANTSNAVTVNIGQSTGDLLGAKSLKKQDGNDPLIGQVQGNILIQYDLGNDYWVMVPSGDIVATKGYIQTELEVSGTDLIIRSPKMEIDGLIVQQANITIDLTSLVASTWYACVMNETTGSITAEDIATIFNTGVGGNWDITGNQLDMYSSIYDSDLKYCQANDGTDNYRVFGVFKTNSTPDAVEHYFYIPNIPYTKVFARLTSDQSLPGGNTDTTILCDLVLYDINSEYSLGTGRYVPVFSSQYVTMQLWVGSVTTGVGGMRQVSITNESTYVAHNAWNSIAGVTMINMSTSYRGGEFVSFTESFGFNVAMESATSLAANNAFVHIA